MGVHLLQNRLLKVFKKVEHNGQEMLSLQNAFVSKEQDNDSKILSIEYYNQPGSENDENLAQDLDLEDPKGRQFLLSQDPAVVEMDQNSFNTIFRSVDPEILSFEMLTHDPIKKKMGIWPVVILNNCSVDFETKDFLAAAAQDDFDLIKEDSLRILLHQNGLDVIGDE